MRSASVANLGIGSGLQAASVVGRGESVPSPTAGGLEAQAEAPELAGPRSAVLDCGESLLRRGGPRWPLSIE